MNDLVKTEEFAVTSVRTEIDTQIATAKNYPRSVTKSLKEASELATQNQDTAESCIYCIMKGGQPLKGPSVRLAEIMASSWGNLHVASRIVSNDGSFITAEAVAWDLEKNVKIASEVKRSILTRAGKTYSIDMQTVTGNAAMSLALRNAIFKVIPKTFVDIVYNSASKAAVGDLNSLADRRIKAISFFEKAGIPRDRILKSLKKSSVEDIGVDDLETMLGIHSAIKDGTLQVENAFSTLEDNSGHLDDLNDKLIIEDAQDVEAD
jgi:hypothetical protein